MKRKDLEGAVQTELFERYRRRTRVVGVFPNERSLVVLTTTVGIRVTEE